MDPAFFNPTDLEHLYNWSMEDENLRYDKTSEDHVIAGQRIKNTLWRPTEFWAREVCKKLGRGFWTDGTHLWHQQAGREKFRFRHYTWYRIFPNIEYHDEIYFTVGVDAVFGLLIKIDFQRRSSKLLNEAQYEYCETNFQQIEGTAYWTSIPDEQWSNYTWDRLIEETGAFIERHLALYKHHVAEVNALAVDSRIARICWNSNGWCSASGREGKSTSPDSHEFKYGFGHEEWLFSDHYILDGWCYTRFEPLASKEDTYVGQEFNLRLYTYNGDTQEYYWVARIQGVKVISREESEEKASLFSNQLEHAVQQVGNHPGTKPAVLRKWSKEDLFNAKFCLDKVTHLGGQLLPFTSGESISTLRYVLLHLSEWTQTLDTNHNTQRPDFGEGSAPGSTEQKKGTRNFTGGVREYDLLHDPLKNTFAQWLQSKHPEHPVTVEARASSYGVIDVIRRESNLLHLYEVKTYTNAFIAIRVAIGQLLTYSFEPEIETEHSQVASLTVVCQSDPFEDPLAEALITYLNTILSIPVSYVHFKVGESQPTCVLPKKRMED